MTGVVVGYGNVLLDGLVCVCVCVLLSGLCCECHTVGERELFVTIGGGVQLMGVGWFIGLGVVRRVLVSRGAIRHQLPRVVADDSAP